MRWHGLLSGLLCAVALAAATKVLARHGTPPELSPAASAARTASFLVDGPNQAIANLVAQQAETLRREISREWFGNELPQPERVTLIYVELDERRSVGRTLATDSDGGHLMWIIAGRAEATGSMLAHEVAHTVLASRFGSHMPAWANEGIASRYDAPERHRTRARILRDAARENLWPDLGRLLTQPVRTQKEYTAAVSLTQFFLTRGSRAEFLAFVADGAERGWPAALSEHYGMASIATLEQEWQTWVTRAGSGQLIVAQQ